MYTGDRLNDEYQLHQRQFAHIGKDEHDYLTANARVAHPRWYNNILAQIGDSLIIVGRSIKEQNASVNSNNFSVSTRQYETFPE